jgi:dTDP-4-amino-4,6-dideoxygalactose transaminase
MKRNSSTPAELALNGGIPVRIKPWPTYDKGCVIIDDEDLGSVLEVIKSKRLFRYDDRLILETQVGKFENELKDFFKVKYALAVSSGTAALSLPLMALGLPPGSLVGCPTYSFTATPSAIIQANLKPFLIEVDRDLHIDVRDLEKKITLMKALVVVHMRGFPAPLPLIKKIAEAHGVPIIEDAVPCLGHRLMDRYLGTFGLAGAFSTQSDKSLNTGEGGFILTNDKDLYLKCIILSGAYELLCEKHFSGENQAIDVTSIPVFNFRLDEIRGALGLTQLKKLKKRLDALSDHYDYIKQQLQDLIYLRIRGTWDDAVGPMGDNLLIAVEGTIKDRCWFAEALTAEGIDAKALGHPDKINVRRFWDWAYLFENKSKDEITNMHPASFEHISAFIDIALSPTLVQEDIEDCINAIKKVHKHYESRASIK